MQQTLPHQSFISTIKTGTQSSIEPSFTFYSTFTAYFVSEVSKMELHWLELCLKLGMGWEGGNTFPEA